MEIGQQPMMQLQESKKLKQSSVLTILVSLKEISFYFNNSHNKSVIDSKLVSIEENNDISSILDLLKKTLSEFDLSNVLKVKLILNNKLSTLVPNELYDEKLNKDYLKYNCDLIDNDTTAVDEIIELDIKNIYVPYENINNFLIETFGSFDFFHFTSILIKKIYDSKSIKERHRHRYEVNINYKDKFEKKGMIFSALSPDKKLPEIIELKNHPWFIGVQFHPEFKSRPLAPHPLFSSFIKAAKNHK